MECLLLAEGGNLGEKMREALLPENVNFFGLGVNPSFFTALIISCVLIIAAVIIRVFAIPRFKMVPGKFQCVLEGIVSMFSNMGECERGSVFVGPYVFSAAIYIFIGTLVELVGLRPVLGDLNACAALALFTYFLILSFGIWAKGPIKGTLGALKDFATPISMSFRLFGSISSGLLVTELIYNYLFLSFGLPIIVGVLFTLFHALIQAYVFAMLSSLFISEAGVAPLKNNKNCVKKKSEKIESIAQ